MVFMTVVKTVGVFYMDLGTNSKFCLTEHKKNGLYDRGEDCWCVLYGSRNKQQILPDRT